MKRCACCGNDRLREFYEVHGIPVHSCLLMDSREEALAYPKGDLVLGFCERCGFVQNTAFDPGLHEYSTRYEETQAFSPRFNSFAKALAERLIERHSLRGKSVLEIGCGKGEFLVLMCELGDMTGIGIDPGYRPERTTSEAASRIRFIQDFYSEGYAGLRGDLVACRHTLEHIEDVRGFVQMLRATIGERADVVVFFEVPDVLRVLDEQAFWDIYYEHCSYFSLGSLARLFRSCGFGVEELWTDFDDQYLLLTARIGSSVAPLAVEDDLAALHAAVDRYEHDVPAKMRAWRADLEALAAAGQEAVVWGSGSKAVAWMTTLGIGDEIGRVVDINPHKHGRFLAGTGHAIVAPEALRVSPPDRVIVMNPIYLDEIRRQCEDLGVVADFVAV